MDIVLWRTARTSVWSACQRNPAWYDAAKEHTRFFLKEHDMAKKTSCPVTRQEFQTHAKPIPVTIGTTTLPAEVKEFSTGSFGWYLGGKTSIEVNGKLVSVQIGMNLTVIGSKELPKEGEAAASASENA
jgi:hypothetical protein